MKPLVYNLDSDSALAAQLAQALNAEIGSLEIRHFPDGETYLRVLDEQLERPCILFCNLFHPDEKILRLLFLADTLKELGATQVILVTPYLAYMRQDKRFQAGECVSSRPFARLLSSHVDALVTLDPHLHRYHSLSEIYSIPTEVVSAAPLIAHWIHTHLKQPLLIGPDSESEQWVSEVARLAQAPYQILEKQRHGDYQVDISTPELEAYAGYDAVLVDDIISSGRTLLETLTHLQDQGLNSATAIGVHGLFAGDAYERLSQQAQVLTSESIPHISNAIEIAPALAQAVKNLMR
ncbi:ribose-phosphate pyrophosphokinase [Nitrincola tapanii]|uniref:ribose-phosphate diphosphokinase n=1 Tax=Nitrincola tapanii TaxID=1708751 RepID=A0A5A9W2Q1_9GAMM|nr:ribose-phosphate pyrophosphokinase [Nitrincola tapanii]KAA0874967.1 ribose-phosphate pyrophosphokinase [Nitrincola tapanii]